MAASKTFSRPIDFRYYRHQIRKRLWLVIVIVLISLGVGTFQVLSTQPLYQSTARLLIHEKRAVSNVFKDPLESGRGGRWAGGGVRTQVKVLRSPALAAQVIHELNLESHPEFVTRKDPLQDNLKALTHTAVERLNTLLTYVQNEFLIADAVVGDAEGWKLNLSTRIDGLRLWLQQFPENTKAAKKPLVVSKPAGTAAASTGGGAALRQELPMVPSNGQAPAPDVKAPSSAFTARFQSRLVIRPDPAAEIISVGFRAHDAKLTAEVANTLAHLYIDFSREVRFTAAEDAVQWLRDRAAETQEQVEKSELELENYKRKHDVYSIEDRIAGLTVQLTALNTKIAEVETERAELEALHFKLRETTDNVQVFALMPSLAENDRIREFKKAYNKIEVDLNQLRKRYGPRHPQVAKLRADLRLEQQHIDDEVEQAIEASEARYELARSREISMRIQFEKLKEEVRELNEIAIGYRTLEREAKSNRRLGDMMLTRLKEASLIPALRDGDTARVIGVARVPKVAINYQPRRRILTAGLAGLVIALGIAAGLGYINNTIETPQEAEEFLGLSVIGLIGKFKPPRRMDPEIDKNLFVMHAPRSQIAEAFKSLRTNMLFSYADSPRKVFMVTSSTPNEGKTTISANLAIVMAQLEHRVLLIEADLRNPSLAEVFKIEGQTGLSELLLEEDFDATAELFDGNLAIVPAGKPPPNPAELLGSRRMQRYLEHVRDNYDIIIIDTPPILAVSDALALNPIVDGTLLVLRASSTSFDQVRRSIGVVVSLKSDLLGASDREMDLMENKASLGMGLVMNFLDFQVGQTYGYYGHYGKYYHD